MEYLASNWLAVVIAAFVAGLWAGWVIGNARGKHQADSDHVAKDVIRDYADYDFQNVGDKADQIVRLANEISASARRAERTMRSLSPGKAGGPRRFK